MTSHQPFDYVPASQAASSRCPCPGLNALANHGYISRTGVNLSFVDLIRAIHHVYNISYPLAILLAFGGFITSGKFSFRGATPSTGTQAFDDPWYIRLLLSFLSVLAFFWTLDLSSLSTRGSFKIAHDGALVHSDTVSSSAPDPEMANNFMKYATETSSNNGGHGLSLLDIAYYHAQREQTSGTLDSMHKRIALGECGFVWLILRGSSHVDTLTMYTDPVVPPERLQQWLGEERLPEGWWDEGGVRPSQSIGMTRARKVASVVDRFAKRKLYS